MKSSFSLPLQGEAGPALRVKRDSCGPARRAQPVRNSMTDFNKLYQEYGEYNILYNQLNMPSPSMEYAWRKTKKIIQDEAQNLINKSQKDMAICDIGCGNGALIIRLDELTRNLPQRVSYEGFELSNPFVNYGRQAAKFKKLPNIFFKRFDIEKDHFQNKYDIIICTEVLEHLHDPKNALERIHHSLNNGGVLLLSTPNSKNLIKYPFPFLKKIVTGRDSHELAKFLTKKEHQFKLAELEQHLYVYSHRELKNILKQLGFTIYRAPRSTTLFGGPFLDNHSLLFAVTILFDSFFDLISPPQLGWDNIFFCRKDNRA